MRSLHMKNMENKNENTMYELENQKINSKKFNKLQIYNYYQFIHYYPRKYENRIIKFTSDLKDGDNAVIIGKVEDIKKMTPQPGLNRTDLYIKDIEGNIIKASFYNEKLEIENGSSVIVYGKAKINQYGKRFNAKDFKEMEDGTIPEGFTGIKPVYHRISGVSSSYIEQNIKGILKYTTIRDYMPNSIITNYNLIDLDSAIKGIHMPQNSKDLKLSKYRLAFDELFFFHLAMKYKRKEAREIKEDRYTKRNKMPDELLGSLPFELTSSQQKAWQDIQNDMLSKYPMRRLVLGDVGSGKTIVAVLALLKAVENNKQGILMAPTETLARQHYQTINDLLSFFNLDIAISVSGEKHDTQNADIIIGTHALFSEKSAYCDPGIIIIDEQHRFGVEQRNELARKANNPDLLVMTATPIPRTLALTFYGDLDLTLIDELPQGRQPVKTGITKSEDKTIEFITNEISKGHQAFIVCPLVEESEKLELQSAKELYSRIQKKLAPYNAGLLHGRMDPGEKEYIMNKFKENKISVLVSTTVVEVGVDVPNATVMAIFEAERFGLAQLHQLRGRVGRGQFQSYCICVAPNASTEKAQKRLKAFSSTNDGYKLSEYDLQLRGAGEIFGSKQSGLYDLKIASLRDNKMVEMTKEAAGKVKINDDMADELYRRYGIKTYNFNNNYLNQKASI